MKINVRLTITVCVLGLSLSGTAEVPSLINYQGRLTDLNGAPIQDGSISNITFSIYDNDDIATAPAGLIWQETQTNVPVYNGLFSVRLGSVNPLDPSDPLLFPTNAGITRWLEVKVNDETLSPRKELVSVAYAFRASDADMVDGKHASELGGVTNEFDPQVGVIANNYVPRWDVTNLITGNIYNDPAGNIGIGTTNPMSKLDVDGSANINGPLSVAGILSVTGTNIIQVMGTNILAMWPHTSVVTNLNADMVDGLHADAFGGVIDHGSLLGLADDDHTQYHNNTRGDARYAGAGWDTATTLVSAQNHIARTDNPHSVTLGQLGHYDNNTDEEAPGYGTRGEPTREEIELWGDRYDDVGITSEDDPQVGIIANNYVPRWDRTNLVTGSIYDNGNVGIGTEGPGEKLEVSGNILLSDGGSRLIRAYVSDDTSTPALEIKVKKNVLTSPFLPVVDNKLSVFNTLSRDGNSDNIPATRIESAIDTVGSGHRWSAGIRFSTQSDSYSWGVGSDATMFAERMRITGNGNVGIGTTGPRAKVSIDRAAGSTISTANGYLNIGEGGEMFSVGKYALINFGYGVVQSPAYIGYLTTALHNYGKGDLVFGTRNDATVEQTPVERMRITSDGNVGIGTPSPAYKLDVNGNAMIRGGTLVISAGDHRIQTLQDDSWGKHQFLALRAEDNMTVLVPGYNGFRVTDYGGSLNNLVLRDDGDLWLQYGKLWQESDSRQKLDQEPLDYGLAEVLKLEPKRYVLTGSVAEAKTGKQKSEEEEGESEIGLIAQEVYEVVPEAVAMPDESRETWCLSYSSLVPVLVKAVQEQQKQIEELKDKITWLEKKIQ